MLFRQGTTLQLQIIYQDSVALVYLVCTKHQLRMFYNHSGRRDIIMEGDNQVKKVKREGGPADLAFYFDTKFKPKDVKHRDQEKRQIVAFLEASPPANNILLITGMPGSGKTLLLESILTSMPCPAPEVLRINCMKYKSTSDFVMNLSQELGLPLQDDLVTLLRNLEKSGRAVCLLCDEFDHLLALLHKSKNINTFMKIQKSPFIKLICISNNHVLLSQNKESIQYNLLKDVEQIKFQPYSVTQLVNIVLDRVKEVQNRSLELSLSQQVAQMCAHRISSEKQGDSRCLLQVMASTLQSQSCSSSPDITYSDFVAEYQKKFGKSQLHKIIEYLPQSQQLFMVVLYKGEEQGVRVSKAQQDYNCIEPGLTRLSTSDFLEIVNSYCTYNIIEVKHGKGVKGGKANRMSATLSLKVSKTQLRELIQSNPALEHYLAH